MRLLDGLVRILIGIILIAMAAGLASCGLGW